MTEESALNYQELRSQVKVISINYAKDDLIQEAITIMIKASSGSFIIIIVAFAIIIAKLATIKMIAAAVVITMIYQSIKQFASITSIEEMYSYPQVIHHLA